MSFTAIADYGMGNLASVTWALQRLNRPCKITADSADFAAASHIILPGVGSFKQAMDNLHSRGLAAVLNREVLEGGKPVLGICLGMQLLATAGEEDGPAAGLGWIPGRVVPLPETGLRIPHIGWNTLTVQDTEWLGPVDQQDVYFIHSYHFVTDSQAHVAATVPYGAPLTAAVHRDNIFGTQFHPEKSQAAGLLILEQFYALNA